MSENIFVIGQEVDLARENPTMRYEQPLEFGDDGAHMWCVSVRRRGAGVNLSGAVSAKCFVTRAAGAAEKAQGVSSVTVIQDAKIDKSRSMVSCVFNKGCYGGVGAVRCVMRVYGAGGSVIAMAKLSCVLERSTSDAVYDPEGLVPSMDALLSMISVMEAATKDAQDAAALANEAAQSANFTVLGQYDTLELLEAAHPTGKAGNAYAIGTQAPYIVYIWDVDKGKWRGIGQLQGATGPTGPQGPQGVSPTIAVEDIEGGHRVSVTDVNRTQVFEIPDGADFAGYDQALNKASDVTFNSVTTVQPINAGKLDDREASEYALKDEITPIATSDTLGCVKVGDGLSVTADGTISASGSSGVKAASVVKFVCFSSQDLYGGMRQYINDVNDSDVVYNHLYMASMVNTDIGEYFIAQSADASDGRAYIMVRRIWGSEEFPDNLWFNVIYD